MSSGFVGSKKNAHASRDVDALELLLSMATQCGLSTAHQTMLPDVATGWQLRTWMLSTLD